MRPAFWLVLALGFGGLAALLRPPPAGEGADVLTSLGHSLGGLRVLAVDVLFLRAERLRRNGFAEEVPALYDAVFRLDPDNTAAADYLAQVYAYDLLGQAPDGEARFSWWQEAWRTIEGALARHPDDPSLLMRSSDLLLDVAPRDTDLEGRVAAWIPRPERRGIERLLAAARAAATLPRRGRIHLVGITLLLPVVAALELRSSAAGGLELAARGREILAFRRAAFEETRVPADDPEPGPPLAEALEARLEAVEAVARALEAGDRLTAGGHVAAWRAAGGDPVLADALQRAVEGR